MTSGTDIDWGRLGYGGHPVPGSAQGLETGAAFYRTTARGLNDGTDALGRIIGATDENISQAVDAMSVEIGTTRTAMADLHTRYDAVATALAEYAPQLTDFQRRAEAAARKALAARTRYEQVRSQHSEYVQQMMTLDSDVRGHYLDLAHQAAAQAGSVKKEFEAARAEIERAVSDRDTAADSAAGKIRAAIDASTINDSFGDQVAAAWNGAKLLLEPLWEAAKPYVQWVIDHLDEIALVLDVIGTVVAFIPGATGVGLFLKGAARVIKFMAAVRDLIRIARDIRQGHYSAAALGLLGMGAAFLAAGVISAKTSKLIGSSPIPGVRVQPSLAEKAVKTLAPHPGKIVVMRWVTPGVAWAGREIITDAVDLSLGKLTDAAVSSRRQPQGSVL